MTAGRTDDGEAAVWITRARLAVRVGDAALVVLEAPGGYGKSTFAQQLVGPAPLAHVHLTAGDTSPMRLVARLRDACRVGGFAAAAEVAGNVPADHADVLVQLSAVGAAMVRTIPAGGWLVVEDVQVLDGDALEALAGLCSNVASPWRIVLTGRSIAHSFEGEVRLGADELAFDSVDTRGLLGNERGHHGGDRRIGDGDDVAATITRECVGWPAAIGLAVASASRGLVVHDVTDGLGTLVDTLLADGGMLGTRAVAALGRLPVLSDAIGEAIGEPNLIATVLASGLPIRAAGPWWRLADPVRDALGVKRRMPIDDLVASAAVMFGGGETHLAVELLMDADRPADLCRLIATMPFAALDLVDVDEMAAVLQSITPDVIAQHPRCLAQIARAAESRVRIDVRTALLTLLGDVVAASDDPVVQRELEAELVCDLARDSLVDETEARGRALLARTPRTELVTRARCLRALGRATAWRGDDRSLVDASHLLAEAAGAARAVRNDVWLADALCTLGYSVLFARGDFEHALSRLGEGVELLGRRSRQRAVQLTFLAEMLALLGRDDEAITALNEARSIGRVHADERILGYAAWTQARVVARRRETDTTLRWLREAERHPGDWLDHPTGTQFLAEAAEIAAMVGGNDVATAYLDRSIAQAAAQGWPEIPEVAIGVLAARFGDAQQAEALLDHERVDAYLNASNRWRVTLLVAHARLRRGDLGGATTLAASVVEQLDALGHPEFAMLHEPECWPALVRLLDGDSIPTVRVTVLGGFAVAVDGNEVAVPSGKPAQLIKLLAVAGRPLPVDEVAEMLWPDSAPAVGRRRLRNVLTRVRGVGPLLDRDEGVIALVPNAEVDSRSFERSAQGVVASADPQPEVVRSALALYGGELLPADRFEEWTASPRERMQRRAVRLQGLAGEIARRTGDLDGAVEAAEALLQLDGFDDAIALQTAAALLAAGHHTRAGAWAARAADIRRELGFPVPSDPMDLLTD